MDVSAALDTAQRADLDSEIARELGHDLWSLVCSIGAHLSAATPVCGDNYPGYRPNAFRLQFADGRVFKGRCVDSPAQAEAVEYLSRCLGYRGLPRVLARRGGALLTEWIEGQPLAGTPCDEQVLRQCGALQGWAHSQVLPASCHLPPSVTIESRRRGIQRDLDALVALATIDNEVARQAAEIAGAYVPASGALGVAYVDFCADNIVQHESGELYVVDNETLSIQPCDYDLGRTWYRWPMNRADRAAYYRGYRAHHSLEGFLAHFPYWAIAALVDGARFRARRGGAAAAAVPVNRLGALLRDLARGVGTEEAIFQS